jgi:hypothetical protein
VPRTCAFRTIGRFGSHLTRTSSRTKSLFVRSTYLMSSAFRVRSSSFCSLRGHIFEMDFKPPATKAAAKRARQSQRMKLLVSVRDGDRNESIEGELCHVRAQPTIADSRRFTPSATMRSRSTYSFHGAPYKNLGPIKRRGCRAQTATSASSSQLSASFTRFVQRLRNRPLSQSPNRRSRALRITEHV